MQHLQGIRSYQPIVIVMCFAIGVWLAGMVFGKNMLTAPTPYNGFQVQDSLTYAPAIAARKELAAKYLSHIQADINWNQDHAANQKQDTNQSVSPIPAKPKSYDPKQYPALAAAAGLTSADAQKQALLQLKGEVDQYLSCLETTSSCPLPADLINAQAVVKFNPAAEPIKPTQHQKVKVLERTNDLFFHLHSQFWVWMFAFCLLIGCSLALIFPTLYQISSIFPNYRDGISYALLGGSFVLAILLCGLIVGLSGGGWIKYLNAANSEYYLSFVSLMEEFQVLLRNPKSAMLQLILLGASAPFFAVVGIYFINFQISRIDTNDSESKLVKRFHQLNEALNFFLFVLAVLVTGTTITTALGREALIQALPAAKELLFPIEFVYLYGLTFTAFIAVVYIPIYVQLKRKGLGILEHLHEAKGAETVSDQEDSKETTDAPKPNELWVGSTEDVFRMKTSAFNTAKVVISILGPIGFSLLNSLLHL